MVKTKKLPVGKPNRRTSSRVIVKKIILKRKTIPKAVKVDKGILLCTKNQFLAVRNEDGGFYLCRAKQAIHANLIQFLAQWLEETSPKSGHYELVYCDHVPTESIIDQVKLFHSGKEFELKEAEKKRIIRKIQKMDNDDDDDDEEDGDDDESDDSDSGVEPATKKSRRSSGKSVTSKSAKTKKVSLKRKSTSNKKESIKPKLKVKKTASTRGLQPKTHIKVLPQDPLFHSRDKIPHISALADSRLVMRAVFLKDAKLLQSYINDRTHISTLEISRCIEVNHNAIMYAVDNKNLNLVKQITDDISPHRHNNTEKVKEKPPRVSISPCLLSSIQTGSYNKMSLAGLPHIRKLAMSRGSKEGNNAFLESDSNTEGSESYLDYCLYKGVDKSFIERLDLVISGSSNKSDLYESIHIAIRAGNHILAGQLVEEVMKTGSNSFNNLHHLVLISKNEKLPTGIREASVKKKPWDNKKITPMHCAAINPNPYYLTSLYNILPDFNLVDNNNMKPIHYAAACTGTATLHFLMSRGNLDEADGYGKTPLMIAAELGRVDNIELIMKESKKSATEVTKLGAAGINRPNVKDRGNYCGFTALHYAIYYNQLACVKKLTAHGADIEKPLGASRNRRTPVMIAAQRGSLEVLTELVEKGAKPDRKDKLRKTALIYACINGHTHIVSYLLHIGCDANAFDSSGNTPLHYAAAYGWYFPVKILIEAGANASSCNDWKLTPLAVAYLKGHIGLANVLLDESKGSIDFRLDGGDTLVMMACSSSLTNHSIVDQVRYLVEEKGANCTLLNDANKNALHILAGNATEELAKQSDKSRAVEIARILLKHGCDINVVDEEGLNPLVASIKASQTGNNNNQLATFLLNNDKSLKGLDYKDSRGITLLHLLAQTCLARDTYPMAKLLMDKLQDAGKLSEVLESYDDDGYTPLLRACKLYKEWNEVFQYHHDKDDIYYGLNYGDEEGGDDQDFYERHNTKHDATQSNYNPNVLKSLYWYYARKLIRLMISRMGMKAFEMVVKTRKKKEGADDDTKEVYTCPEEAEYSIIDFFFNVSKERSVILIEKDENKSNDKRNDNNKDRNKDRIEEEVAYKEKCPGINLAFRYLNKFISENEGNNNTENSFGKYVNKYDRNGLTPFMNALIKHNEPLSKLLLKYKADVTLNSCSKFSLFKGTILMIVIRKQMYDEIPRLLKAGGTLKFLDERSQCNALHFVCMKPNQGKLLEHLRLFLSHGLNPNQTDVLGQTPLHKLAKHTTQFNKEILESMEVLMNEGGVKVDARDKQGKTALHLSVANNNGDVNSTTEFEQALVEKCPEVVDVEDRSGRMPIHYAYIRSSESLKSGVDPIEMTYFLTHQSRDVLKMVNHSDVNNMTPLHLATCIGAGFCSIHLVEKGSDLNAKTNMGNTPLSLAVKSGVESCVMLLLQKKAKISCDVYTIVNGRRGEFDNKSGAQDDDGKGSEDKDYVPKENEGEDEDEEEDEEYEDEDDESNYSGKNKDKDEKVEIEVEQVDEDRVIKCDNDIYKNVEDRDEEAEKKKKEEEEEKKKDEELVGRKMVKMTWRPDEDVKSLPVKDSHYPVIKGVILHSWQGVMFMMLEGVHGSAEISLAAVVKLIFETQKFNLALNLLSKTKTTPSQMNHRDSLGRTLAHHFALNSSASHTHFDNVMRLLQQRGTNFESKDNLQCIPLHYACLAGNLNLVQFILDQDRSHATINHKDHLNRPPLAAILWNSNSSNKLTEFLVKQGASLNFVCAFPIHKYAIQRAGRVANCAYLDTDTLLDDVCLVQLTPLMYAIARENTELCKELIILGADVNMASGAGVTPIMMAVALNNHTIISILLQSADTKWLDQFKYPSFFFNPPKTRQIKEVEEKSNKQAGNIFLLGMKNVTADADDKEDKDYEEEGEEDETSFVEDEENASGASVDNYADDDDDEDGDKEDGGDGNDGDVVMKEKTEEEKKAEKEKREEEKKKKDEIDDERMKFMFKGFCMHFNPLKKTSKLDLNKPDNNGRSLLHYLLPIPPNKKPINPKTTENTREKYGPEIDLSNLQYPAYDNHSLFLFLLSLGATFERADKTGVRFRERAQKNGCVRILTAINYHFKQPFNMTFANLYDNTSDGFKAKATIDKTLVTPVTDSRDFVEEYEKKNAKSEIKFKPVPDSNLDASMQGSVHIDGDTGKPCDVLLFKIDVKLGAWGLYNFYKLQLIHQKNKDLYILFTRWGRIGDKGQFQQTPFGNLQEALKEFHKVFKAKTANDWSNYDSFEEKPKKYKLVSLENRVSRTDETKIPIEMTSKLESKLVPTVRELIKEMTNESSMNNRLSREGLSLILSRVNRQQIADAKLIVDELKENIVKLNDENRKDIPDLATHADLYQKIADLSNQYHRILPQKGYEFEKLAIFDNLSHLNNMRKNLDILSELEIATRFMLASMNKKSVLSPYDYVYSCLDTRICPMPAYHPETQLLIKYIKASWSGKVEAIFKVNRLADQGKFQAPSGPRKLLFHGSSATNLISILSRGLLIQPSEAEFTGAAFGNGIYLADTFEKSIHYCHNYHTTYSQSQAIKYMLICEADLGDTYHVHTNYPSQYPPEAFNSLLVLGYQAPDPTYDLTLPSGAIVPQGDVNNDRNDWDKGLHNLVNKNEYVVYEPEKVAIRYIVQFVN